MNVLLFNGCSDQRPDSTGRRISAYLHRQLSEKGYSVTQVNVSDAHIPFFQLREPHPAAEVEAMVDAFLQSDLQIWLTPLYHGGMTGAMKNCLDWLEITSQLEKPYLTDKVVGLVCWADGGQAMQGINAMDAVAKALRAWVLPYTVPLVKNQLYADAHRRELSGEHTRKLDRLLGLLGNARQSLAIT
ncbi:MAG TPA: NADPH-dependent FMN reductase [Puia sp.]|jgi:arsenic resistance protein ArsH|nr:NADPH-dependent FMN reductase [Puia sp.]